MLLPILATLIPTLFYTLLLWWLDRYEKEPLPLLLAAFLWGSIPAVALAIFFGHLLGGTRGPTVVAPLIEEPLKAAALLTLFLFFRREFDGVLDGIIYGALVGFGFAMTENALYFLHSNGSLSLLIWLRIVLLGLGHAFFTSIVGVAFGLIRYERRWWMALLLLLCGLGLSIFFHSLSNQAVSQRLIGWLVAWAIQSGGAVVVLLVALLAWRHERSWLSRELVEEIERGLITPQEYRMVCSSTLRVRAQLHALLHGGWAAFLRERQLHHLLTELALLKYQLRIGDRFFSPDDLADLREQVRGIGRTAVSGSGFRVSS